MSLLSNYGVRAQVGDEKIIQDGLLLHLDAGNPNSYPGSGTTWLDLSGNGRHGTLYNGIGFSTTAGGTLTFNGSNQYGRTSLLTTVNNSITMSGWFRTFNRNQKGQMIFYNGSDANGNGYGFSVNNEATTHGRVLLLYGAIAWIDTGFQTVNNTWYYGTMVIESDRSNKFYINGNLVFTGGSRTVNSPGSYTEIGRNDYPAARYFNGNIAELSFYNRVLTPAEIQFNYNLTKQRFGL